MTDAARRFYSPTLARYLRREVLRMVLLTLVTFVALSLIADFFDRVDTFLRHDASLGTILRSFLYRAPLVVVQVSPMAILAGSLIALGLMARHREFVALRACGRSWTRFQRRRRRSGVASAGSRAEGTTRMRVSPT